MPSYQVFYDDACPMCRFEMQRLQRLSAPGQFDMIDVSAAAFDAGAYGFERVALDALLHIRRDDGAVLIGIDAIAALYQAVGRGWWTLPVQWSAARPVLSKLYGWVAQNRYHISAGLGFSASKVCTVDGCGSKKLAR